MVLCCAETDMSKGWGEGIDGEGGADLRQRGKKTKDPWDDIYWFGSGCETATLVGSVITVDISFLDLPLYDTARRHAEFPAALDKRFISQAHTFSVLITRIHPRTYV